MVEADLGICDVRFGYHAAAVVEYWDYRAEDDLSDVYEDASG